MGIYWRYKQNPGGFRNLVELLESTPPSRRQKMVDAGLAEDAGYTMDALKYVMDFNDILSLPDMELAEVVAKAPPQIVAYALRGLTPPNVERFLRCARPAIAAEIKVYLESAPSPRDISGAQMKLITTARELEKRGLVKTKMIPNAA